MSVDLRRQYGHGRNEYIVILVLVTLGVIAAYVISGDAVRKQGADIKSPGAAAKEKPAGENGSESPPPNKYNHRDYIQKDIGDARPAL